MMPVWQFGLVLFDAARLGRRVQSGPFGGLFLPHAAPGSAYWPKILGTYEKELHGEIEVLAREGYDLIVNVGAGEGFYALGLRRLLPGATVVAFEENELARRALERNARGTGGIVIRGSASVESLDAALGDAAGRVLVVMDVEGEERRLLDPAGAPGLSTSDILVELHEFAEGGIEALLRDRFSTTHECRMIDAEDRTAADFPDTIPSWFRKAMGKRLEVALHEFRPERMRWLVFRVRK